MLRVRSLAFAILVAMVVTLTLSFVVFRDISTRLTRQHFDPVYERLDDFQMEAAINVLRTEGTHALENYLDGINSISKSKHYLVDAFGRDVLTGEDRTAFLPPAPLLKWRVHNLNGYVVASRRSADGEYWFVAAGALGHMQLWTFLPYYLLTISATMLLCWLASVGVVSPLHRIAGTIQRFGHGDLSARVKTGRVDEIGQLSGAFNQMADRLQRVIASERRLLADISHELRSPLARLKFAIRLARTSDDPQAALDRIHREVDRISALVAGIVEIAVVEGDPAAQGMTLLKPQDVVHEVVEDCRLEADAHGCRIELAGELRPEVMGNHELLRRALENVLRNAIRYSPEGAAIDVTMAEEAGTARIAVRDFGPGVPAEMLTRIFDPLVRIEEARDALGGGSGLGLSIAKRAVELHHGTITAENAAPGLRVEIRIPLLGMG